MLQRLGDDGFKVISIVDPGVKHDPGYRVYDQGVERDVFCRTAGGDTYIGQVWPGNTVFPDFSTEAGRDWWGELNAAHVASGLAGIWNDMNEPATGNIPPDRMLVRGRGRAAREVPQPVRAVDGDGNARGAAGGKRPELRTFILSRAGFAGIQRFAANWMGDNQARWDHLRLAAVMGSGFGLSGQPFVGADIGGFQGDSNAELFLRWMQLGTLTPFCRNHSETGNIDQYVWSFGEEVLDLAREAVRLRYRLMPYLYTAFVRASETGEPVQRPLVLDFQYDPAAVAADDQFLLGPDLLVAPVIEAGMTARARSTCPRGTGTTGTRGAPHRGSARHRCDSDGPDPVVRQSGSRDSSVARRSGIHRRATIPRASSCTSSTRSSTGAGSLTLVEDDGLTFESLTGARLTTTVVVERSGEQVSVRVVDGGGGVRRSPATVVHRGAALRLNGSSGAFGELLRDGGQRLVDRLLDSGVVALGAEGEPQGGGGVAVGVEVELAVVVVLAF